MKRRQFFYNSALATTSMMVPSFLRSYPAINHRGSRSKKIFVVIQLSGGNDGLNTVVPYRSDVYYNLRPTLALKPAEILKLNDQMGFHPAMTAMQNLFQDGLISVVNNVGYPNPNRSHFRSMDIWQSASPSNKYYSDGWLGRYLDSACQSCKPHYAIEVSEQLSLALKGNEQSGFAVPDAARLKKPSENKLHGQFLAHHDHHDDSNLSYLYKVLAESRESASYLSAQVKKNVTSTTYPAHTFGRDMKQIANLILSDAEIGIYYVSLSGFDTHANQKNQQGRLLKIYSEAVSEFVSDLRKNGLFDDTLIMTFSEFGRRAKQNGSNGTDHGTANNVFLISGDLKKPGFFNKPPDLSNLVEHDLVYDIDFREIYATILENWLDTSSHGILKGDFKRLGIV